ncbi:MAG: hypothetical protein FXF49_10035 [Flexistipes sinusarabici]|uniref:Uncharacterized protein n=1 Tax=Flexistipes sinusarabici TaxID=2352 RepID=A0A5D0MLB5_FLESI|nr:hypothetical protein [Flexistipes sinusarabici]TYB32725.1 MAG: hypothetical protein FXF49_10035 [Flexistipes sinusarabici]
MKPSEFYKIRRPDFFSDSKIINEVVLPREVLAYELSKISTNQKQDEFETLCRRLAEKFITPNLIPQVGPTGGGDGKTDSETYPVSPSISDRWFIPENGWNKDEKWAFAISAKEEWKGKAKGDIKKIVNTKRDYTRVYFMTNQLVSSKKKKNAQDEFVKEFDIEVIILDGEWILEHIYNNKIIEIAVDSLNLSDCYKNKEKQLGTNDAIRLEELEKLEQNISNTNRYFEYDFQLVEDALETAILSRMLEKPRAEVEGKFDRAFRFCKKVDNSKQWIRIYYQRAWTYLNWYDDYPLFVEDYKHLKTYVSKNPDISNVELYFNLFNLLNGLSLNSICNLADYGIDIENERIEIIKILSEFENDEEKPNSALTAKTYKTFIELTLCIHKRENPANYFKTLSDILLQSKTFIDYPFESTRQIIEELGDIFPDDTEYDNLIDSLAELSERRYSELASGEIFVRRGGQKLDAKCYKESIVYFGKAVIKLAKEESKDGMCLVLLGLGMAYRELGLIWASNNCYISVCALSFKSISESGKPNERIYQSLEEIIKNELFIGRLPPLFTWFEMLSILNRARMNIQGENKEDIPFDVLTDGCLSTRILHTDSMHTEDLQYLPDLLEKLELFLSCNTVLYKLGHIDKILDDYNDMSNEQDLDEFFKIVANQPFVEQILYQTIFMSQDDLHLSSSILGCSFLVKFPNDIEILLVAETLLAFLEGFFATSMSELMSHTEHITINLRKTKDISGLEFEYNEMNYEYNISVESFNITTKNRNLIWDSLLKLVTDILVKHFIAKDIEHLVSSLFKKEEIHERLSLIIEHRNFMINLLGNDPKLFFYEWKKYANSKQYISKRETPISYKYDIKEIEKDFQKKDIEKVRHDEIKTHSIIDVPLWEKAKWRGFGFCFHPQEGLGIILAYENIDAGAKIFDKWINKFGREDKLDLIKITIIKGIDERNPYWYRVHISANIKYKNSLQSSTLVTVASRIHEMNANSPENLNNLLDLFNRLKKYKLYPAKISQNGNDIKPFIEKGILKTTLTIKDAWEIGKNDVDRVVIRENDKPIIPDGNTNAPVFTILNQTNHG